MKGKFSLSDAKEIAITGYLSRLGIEPVKIRGNDHWYYSPFRNEKTPSFKVNVRKNVWFDHGSGEGGTIIDLGTRLHNCSLPEFLNKLSDGDSVIMASAVLPDLQPENRLHIHSIKEINDSYLIHYLKHRSVPLSVAKKFCHEISFQIGEKIYSAVGFPNQSGGFELRNSWFKGSSSPKDISFIKGNDDQLCVLEGFIDFLSLIQFKENKLWSNDSNFLVLNSLSLLNKNINLIKGSKNVLLFLDNDAAGIKAKESLSSNAVQFSDMSGEYAGFKDLNEFLVESRKGARPFIDHNKKKGFSL